MSASLAESDTVDDTRVDSALALLRECSLHVSPAVQPITSFVPLRARAAHTFRPSGFVPPR